MYYRESVPFFRNAGKEDQIDRKYSEKSLPVYKARQNWYSVNVDKGHENVKGHRICAVEEGSAAWELGIEPGMYLVSVDGQEIEDIFDYRFLMSDEEVQVLIREENGDETLVTVSLEEGEDFGLTFENSLMSSYRSCRNRCIFCFIDQMPPGMRETLYFKDDDSRLSFLQGNYITLTNLTDHDVERIIRYRMEPVNISVQTTNPDLRVRMLRNRFAGEALQKMRTLKEAGISMNGQIVLCRHWNDGAELERTIRDLTEFLPEMQSVSVVPVGLSRFREGLEELEPFSPSDAAEVIDIVESWQTRIYEKLKASYVPEEGEEEPDLKRGAPRHFIHASDEWYILAGRPLPEEERYDGYLQYENGVGMVRLLMNETRRAIRSYAEKRERGELRDLRPFRGTSVCGTLIAPVIRQLGEEIREVFPDSQVDVVPVRNRFFGESITVTGLLTGTDIIRELRERLDRGSSIGEALLLPRTTLRRGDRVFLDDYTVEDLETELGTPVRITEDSGEDLVRSFLGFAPIMMKERQYYE